VQLYAFDVENKIVSAAKAIKGTDYYCPECRSVLHRRGGIHRQDHFYHLESTSLCRQNGKGLEHLQTQLYFQQSLPPGECALERSFPTIARIADVYWEKEKLVFEVQCAPISSEEVLARTRDYNALGLTVVWVFHDVRYNKRRHSAAELALWSMPHYFTNIDAEGRGDIYDQLCLLQGGGRRWLSQRQNIDISHPRFFSPARELATSSPAMRNRIARHLYFVDDALDVFIKGDIDGYCAAATAREAMHIAQQLAASPSPLSLLGQRLLTPARVLFQIILERFCR
jgi:competence protein CoiA